MKKREKVVMRLKDRVAIVVGAGQSPGEGMGNGRATALTFAREGAKVLCVDHNLESAQETAAMIAASHGTVTAFKADVTRASDIKAMVAEAQARWGRIDVLHNNVGVSLAGGDAELLQLTEEAFDRVVAINLKSCILAAKEAIRSCGHREVARSSTSPRWPRSRPILSSPTRRRSRR
jgi:NAD(P)-dependent dehydrogenase (short-subunit alcohol dehydrogenase family)